MSPSVPPASSRTRFRSPSGRVYVVSPDRHRPKLRRPERSHHRHIERIAAPSNQHPTDSPGVVAGIESPPPAAPPHLHAGVEIHWLRRLRNIHVAPGAGHV